MKGHSQRGREQFWFRLEILTCARVEKGDVPKVRQDVRFPAQKWRPLYASLPQDASHELWHRAGEINTRKENKGLKGVTFSRK